MTLNQKTLLLPLAALSAIGLLAIFSSTRADVGNTYVVRQAVWIALGFIAMLVAAQVRTKTLAAIAPVVYAAAVLMLGLVLLVGKGPHGTRRWFELGLLRFQPSELAKVGTILMLSRFLAEKAPLGDSIRSVLNVFAVVGLPALLVLYEPDMRLRPSGGSGPLVSHVEGFEEYQMDKAWTWEHQAIVKARPVSGNIQVKKRFEQIRKAVLSRPRNKAKLQKEIVEMRQRMRKELLTPQPGIFDLKQDTGGIVDIEFLVQYLVLLHSHKNIELVKWTDNVRILETLIETGILEDDRAVVLKEAYLTYRAAVHRLNLQEKPSIVPEDQFADLRKRIEEIWADIMGR